MHRKSDTFNCAAPFRERLSFQGGFHPVAPAVPSIVPLPFGSGYPPAQRCGCRWGSPSIVPLPFGSGYKRMEFPTQAWYVPSIVPLPFGSGYADVCLPVAGRRLAFNCAAPFRERLSQRAACGYGYYTGPSIVPLPFGSGYQNWPAASAVALGPSIVPLPFGSGYRRPGRGQRGMGQSLQLCRSLSGAVIWHRRLTTA